jgi:hypothetical protein
VTSSELVAVAELQKIMLCLLTMCSAPQKLCECFVSVLVTTGYILIQNLTLGAPDPMEEENF